MNSLQTSNILILLFCSVVGVQFSSWFIRPDAVLLSLEGPHHHQLSPSTAQWVGGRGNAPPEPRTVPCSAFPFVVGLKRGPISLSWFFQMSRVCWSLLERRKITSGAVEQQQSRVPVTSCVFEGPPAGSEEPVGPALHTRDPTRSPLILNLYYCSTPQEGHRANTAVVKEDLNNNWLEAAALGSRW